MRQVCQTNRPSEYLSIIQGDSLKGRTKQNSTTQSRLEIPLLRPLHMFSGHPGKPNRTLASLTVTTADWWWSELPGDWTEAEFFFPVSWRLPHISVFCFHMSSSSSEGFGSVEKVVLLTFLSVVILMAILGNLLVMVAVCRDRQLRWALQGNLYRNTGVRGITLENWLWTSSILISHVHERQKDRFWKTEKGSYIILQPQH